MKSDYTLSPTELARWSCTGLLAALALLLGYVEVFIPIPLPGVKLGLANIPVLVSLSRHDIKAAASIAAIKILATGLLFGSPLTMAYAIAGTTLSFMVMAPISQLRTMRLWMASVVGALLHETGQLLVASAIMGTTIIWRATPLLFGVSCITGAISGVLAQSLARALPEDARLCVAQPHIEARRPNAKLSLGFVALVAFVMLSLRLLSARALLVCLALALLACMAAKVAPRALLASWLPCLSIALVSLVMALLVHGLTQQALSESLCALLRLLSIASASLATMTLVPNSQLTGLVAWLVSPLERVGVNTSGFVVAFHTALRLAPAFVRAANRRWTKGETRLKLRELHTLLPELIDEVLRDIS